jgi:YVTN family beta-propeller protein
MKTPTLFAQLAKLILCLIGLAWSLCAYAEPFAYSTNNADNNMSVIDTATNTVVATIVVGDGLRGVATHPDGSAVYVTNERSGTDLVIDTTTNTVVSTVTLGTD